MDVLGCALPEDRLYDLEQEVWWQDDDAGGTARVGLLATVGAFAGPLRELSFRPVTGPLTRGRSVATVESTRYTGAVRLPVDAEVVERNPAVRERPRLINDRPYADGWIVRVRPVRATDPISLLAPAPVIRAGLEEVIRSRRVHCWPLTPETELVEVGVECTAVLARLDEEVARRAPGEALLLVTDDPTSPIEMVRWSDRSGQAVLAHRTEGSLHQFLVQRVEHPTPRRPSASGQR